jgi:hypothetical protein
VTATARKVLADCKTAHELLEAESDTARFRVLWVSGIALLRSVGHALKEVERKRDSHTADAIDEAWARWKADREKHEIFWEFIKPERDSVLHEYEFGFLSGPVDVLMAPDSEPFVLEDNLFCPITGGRFAGEDCRDVLAEGIAWWEGEPSAIESYEKV